MSPAALRAASATNFAEIRTLLAWEEERGTRRLVGVWALQIAQTRAVLALGARGAAL